VRPAAVLKVTDDVAAWEASARPKWSFSGRRLAKRGKPGDH
jgi:hypothetical protein